MNIALLVPTVACGVAGTLALRASRGLRRPLPVVLAVTFYTLATLGLGRLVLTAPVGAVYAVWAGLASVTLLAIDRFFFREPLRWGHLVGVLVILAGVVLVDLQV